MNIQNIETYSEQEYGFMPHHNEIISRTLMAVIVVKLAYML